MTNEWMMLQNHASVKDPFKMQNRPIDFKVIEHKELVDMILDYTVQLIFKIKGFLDSSVGKESSCNAGDPGSIPGLGRSTGETLGYPLQYSGLENSMDCVVHRLQRVGHN